MCDFLNTSNEADSSLNSSSASSAYGSTKSPSSTSTRMSLGRLESFSRNASKSSAAPTSSSSGSTSSKAKKQVKGNERNAPDLKSLTVKTEKPTKLREAPQDEKKVPTLKTKKGGHQKRQPVIHDKKKSKSLLNRVVSVAAENPHDSIEEYSSSDAGSADEDAIIAAKEISMKAEKRAKEKKEKKKKRQKKDGAIETGFMLSRRTSYRMSKSSLSPHISPVSQSQTRLEFTPKTAT